MEKTVAGWIILIAALLMAVTFMDLGIVFRMMSKQTKDAGTYQLSAIAGELEGTINQAEILTQRLAMAAQEFTDDREALAAYMQEAMDQQLQGENGIFNVYIAGTGWYIVPYVDKIENFVPTERIWYTGAMKNGGKPYVSAPYVDVITGNICYTVSVLLNDRDTVISVDYTMDTIQAFIRRMSGTELQNAVIVTSEGIIAGCSDESLIGKDLLEVLPDYSGIYSLAKKMDGVVTARIRADKLYENLFAKRSGNGWYLIVSEGDWALYRTAYLQLIYMSCMAIILFFVIIRLYLISVRSRQQAEHALSTREEFLQGITAKIREPLNRILSVSDRENTEKSVDTEKDMARIHAAGENLSDMIGQMMSYSSLVKSEKQKRFRMRREQSRGMNRKFRSAILATMIFVMIVTLLINLVSTWRWGKLTLENDAEIYEFQLSEWVDTQKSILDMFCSVISTNPEMLNDYQGTVDYLNRITAQYPEISATYMSNPDLEPTVFMNTGWLPEKNWKVEERQWYIDTLNAEEGWSVSAPYYDEQTGGYCVTFSERVYDARTGEFLGNFGIDFYMAKLVNIMGGSYKDTGYAFLADIQGDIINHPYGNYQMSAERTTNVSELPYGELRPDGKSTLIFRDYDRSLRIMIARRNEDSHFVVYAVSSLWRIYGNVILFGFVSFVAFLVCIILVYRSLTDMMAWQEDTNRRMKDAADSAIAAGTAKSQFLAQMSHEIRTPINAVLGMNEMILRKSKDGEILEYAGNIRSAGKTLLSLINSILDFSKIEDGKMEIIPVRYELAEFVESLTGSVKGRAEDKSLEFSVEVDETLPAELIGDDVRVNQIITNLLTNAVKYTESGFVKLSIRNGGREGDGVVLDVSVEDTGIGIREEDMNRLFESFERLEERRNRSIEGTGLGISIVTKLLDMMGSSLKVESRYGEGSVFSFRLLQGIADPSPVGDYRVRLRDSSAPETEELSLKAPGARVLVVDDNEMNRKVAKNLLMLFGLIPDLSASGKEAIGMIREKDYDLVFMDHLMPELSGVETLKQLKEEGLLKEGTKVVALTANVMTGAEEFYRSHGFDDFLPKPIDVGRLQEKLEKYLPETGMLSGDRKESGNDGDEVLEFLPGGMGADEEAKAKLPPALFALPLNVADGIRYSAGSTEFYMELLRDYAKEGEGRCKELARLLDAKDASGYRNLIHALKSTSRMIGAPELADKAAALEKAAEKGDLEYLNAHHTEFLEDYRKIFEGINALNL
ncbi:MAG: response regulator [Lachnospiraceae bacterium]|nr:response regulator [Lachnospiraceae bacterium]